MLLKYSPLVLIFIFSCLSGSVCAEIFQWTDSNGRLRFSDQKPNTVEFKQLDLKVNISDSHQARGQSAPDSDEELVLYSASWCTYCKKAKRYLSANKISFQEKDIEEDSLAAKSYRALNSRSIPLMLFQGRRLEGFSRKRFEKFYN